MIRFKHKGDFSKLDRYLVKVERATKMNPFDKFGIEGVNALKSATPVESGLTADSWYYEIKQTNGSITIEYKNSNVNDGVPIAVILQYGHGTRTGGWVEGRDYINPAIQPIFDEIVDNAWKEVTNI